MDVGVRPIARDDIHAAVLVIQGGSFDPSVEDPDQEEAYWKSVVATREQTGDVLVATLDGDVVGVCQVLIFLHFQHTGGWCCELESVHVRSDLRSRGIGAALLASAEELARQRGCYRVQLTSRNYRVDAHRFYVANGFESTSQGFKKSLVK
jgi:GNAT superfamily N-acetyltransferase